LGNSGGGFATRDLPPSAKRDLRAAWRERPIGSEQIPDFLRLGRDERRGQNRETCDDAHEIREDLIELRVLFFFREFPRRRLFDIAIGAGRQLDHERRALLQILRVHRARVRGDRFPRGSLEVLTRG
jgi:hypothetical protein